MKTWEAFWVDKEKNNIPIPEKFSSTLEHICSMQFAFPSIYTAVKIMSTIPVNGLALLSVHRDMTLDVDKIIDRFALKNDWRMAMIKMLELISKTNN